MNTRPGEVLTLKASGTNAPAVVTVPGETGARRHVSKVVFSYSDAPTAGLLTVAVGADLRLSLGITAGGPGPLNLNIRGDVSTPIVITLAAGGSGIRGDLYVEYV